MSNPIRYERPEASSTSPEWLAPAVHFEEAWKAGWRKTRRSMELAGSEKQTIDDLSRLRGCETLRKGFEIVRARSTNAADRVALLEQLRGFLIAGLMLDLSEAEATHQETLANHQGNDAQDRHHYYRSLGTREALVEAMAGQAIASKVLADVVRTERPALIQVGR